MRILCLIDFPPQSSHDRWIWNHLPGCDDEVDFLGAQLHDRSARWGKLLTRYPDLYRLAMRALRKAKHRDYDLVVAWESKNGIPLAFLRRLLGRHLPRFVILTFTPGDVSHVLFPFIRFALGSVDHITVLTSVEIKTYQQQFGLLASQISLCLLGSYDVRNEVIRGVAAMPQPSEPYIHASGRSARDYATLVQAIEGLAVKALIHGRDYNFAGLRLPSNVEAGEMVSRDEYYGLVFNALFEVVPLYDRPLPTGSSQIVFAMMMGKAVVATRTGSTVDYIEHGVTGLLVEPGNADAMRAAILYLLQHPAEAKAMGKAARKRFEECHTFEQFACRAHAIMVQVAAQAERH